MTPYQLNLIIETHAKNKETDFKEKLTLAYLTSKWTIQWLGKKSQQPRPLNEILDNIYKEKKVMTDEQMLEKVRILNAMFGGEVKACNP